MQYEIKPAERFSFGISELVRYRELLYFFTWRDIKVKYKQTILGFLWAILQPLIMMLVFTFFFGYTFNIPSENIPYPIFVYSGVMLWGIFSSGISNSSQSMIANANIIKKIYFPRLAIPISTILVALFDFLMAFVVYIFLLIYYDYSLSSSAFIFLPFSVLITLMATFGIGVFISALNVKYRDFRYIIPFLLQLLFFLTPVLYPVSVIKNNMLQKFLALNPMVGAINLMRATITESSVNWNDVALSSLSAFFLFLLGLYYFRKTEYYFADIS